MSEQEKGPAWLPPFLAPAWEWIQSRSDIERTVLGLLHIEIPRGVRTYFLGGIALLTVVVQSVTGVLLALYYRPSPESAYESILYIMNDVPFGWLIRSMHSWSANLMIVACILHMWRTFFQGAYKKPRELVWMAGVVLLILSMAFGLTGYLLPWDQRAYWATTISSEVAGAMPVVGEFGLRFMRGGDDISGVTLSRFYGGHTLVLPAAGGLFLLIHLYLLHLKGLAQPPSAQSEEENNE